MIAREITIGVISDTHGLLRPQAAEALRGSEFIIHAGDIGEPGILQELSAIAPVTAVRGNVDRARCGMISNTGPSRPPRRASPP
jgi:putative phosphoesterase